MESEISVVVDAGVPFPFSTLIIGNRPANFRQYVNSPCCPIYSDLEREGEEERLMSRPFPTLLPSSLLRFFFLLHGIDTEHTRLFTNSCFI